MITIKYQNGQNEIYNEAGPQAKGSYAPGLEGLNPRELLEASLGLCVSITLKKLLERDNIPFDDAAVHIEVTAQKDEGGVNRFSHFHIKMNFPPNLDEPYKKKAMIIIERGCTISNTLKNSSTVEIEETPIANKNEQ